MINAVSRPVAGAPRRGDLLGPPPIISGEDPNEYAEVLERIEEDLKPRDFIEAAFIRDVGDHIGRFAACAASRPSSCGLPRQKG